MIISKGNTPSFVMGHLPGSQWVGGNDTFGTWPLGPLKVPCPSHTGQVVSSILRNLSWRADINSKKVLREVGSMTALMECVLRASKVSMGSLGLGRSEGTTRGSEWGETPGQVMSTLSLGKPQL